jgi:hypothetical protein
LQNEAQDAQTHWSITPFISVVPNTSDYFALRVHDGTGRIALVDRLCGVLASTPPRSLLVASPSELLGPAGVKIIRANDGHQ